MLVTKMARNYLVKASCVRYSIESNWLCPSNLVKVYVNAGDKCFSSSSSYYYSGDVQFEISLGDKFYNTIMGFDLSYDTTPSIEADTFKHLSYIYDALFYHELGHLLYTPMFKAITVAHSLEAQGAKHFTSLLMNLFNIVEDVVVEAQIKAYKPHTIPLFRMLRAVAFKSAPTVSENLQGALGVTLHNFRCVDSNKLSYPDASIHKMLMTYMYLCINEPDPDVRFHRTIAFTAALWDVFNCKEKPHFTNYKNGLGESFYKDIPDKYKDKDTDDTVESHQGSGGLSSIEDNKPSSSSSAAPKSADAPSPKPGDVDPSVEITSRSFPSIPEESSGVPPEIELSDVQNDPMYSDVAPSHQYIKLSTLFNSESLEPDYNHVVSSYSNIINDVVDIIKKKRAWNNTRWEENKSIGKLSLKAFAKHSPYLYKQRNLPEREADLAVSILCDASGSMGGTKSVICGTALITLSEALDACNIPFEVNAFTAAGNSSGSITVSFKEFSESFHSTKNNLAVLATNKRVSGSYLYGGNVDEINLSFVYDRFKKRKEKDKIIIVISDGETCGSEKVLRDLVNQISDSGIITLGLGVYSRAVERIYKEQQTFKDLDELESLPAFLNNYLLKHIFKKEER